MASTYTASKQATGVQPKFLPTGLIAVCSVFALSAAFVVSDVVQMMTLPVGATIVEVILSTDTALDTNAASTIAYDVGDGASATRFISDKAQGNDAALAPYRMDQAGGHQYVTGTNTGDTTIQVKVHTAPATGATSGNLRLTVLYSMDA